MARVWYGLANITPQQQADAEWDYRGPNLDSNLVLVVGHLARVTVRDRRNGGDDPIEQTWFMVNKLYLTPTGDASFTRATRRSSSTPREPRATPRSSRSAEASSRPAPRTASKKEAPHNWLGGAKGFSGPANGWDPRSRGLGCSTVKS